MGYTTPKVNYTASNGYGFDDVNRTNENIDYLREQNKTINGATSFSNNITQTSGVSSLKATTMNGLAGNFFINTNANAQFLLTEFNTSGHDQVHYLISYGDSHATKADEFSIKNLVGDLSFTADNSEFLRSDGTSISAYKHISLTENTGSSLLTLTNTNPSSSSRISIENGSLSAVFGVGNTTNASTSIAGRQYLFGTPSGGISLIAGDSSSDVKIYSSVGTQLASFSELLTSISSPISVSSTLGVSKALTISDTDGTESLVYEDSGVTKLTASYSLSNDAYRILMNDTTYKQAFAIFRDTQNVIIGSSSVDNGTDKLQIGGSMAVSGAINPTTTPTSGTWGIGTDVVIPRGIYSIHKSIGANGNILQSGRVVYDTSQRIGGIIISDGINTTYTISDGTIDYFKF